MAALVVFLLAAVLLIDTERPSAQHWCFLVGAGVVTAVFGTIAGVSRRRASPIPEARVVE